MNISRLVAVFVASAVLAGISRADLEWGFTGNLVDWDPAITAGWWVQMYHDVDADTQVGTIFQFENDGTPFGTGVSDDILLSSFSVQVVTGKGGTQWGGNYTPAQWGFLTSENVYSVLYNNTSIGAASQAVVVDANSTTLPAVTDPPQTYYLGSINNEWVDVIPEPTTMALLLVGVAGLFGARRRLVN